MEFSKLKGQTLLKIEVLDNERIIFTTDDGKSFESCHMQECRESVAIQEMLGDIDDVIGSPIIDADETFDSEDDPPDHAASWTRTFQTLRTEKGEVVFHWLGESNGYYGETPYFGFTHY